MSLVSKRFHALCLAPQLTKEVSFALFRQSDCATTLRSLHCWMALNAQHLAIFNVTIRNAVDPGLLMGCLTACCVAAPLETLLLSLGKECTEPLPTLAWLLSARSTLSRLELRLYPSTRPLAIDVPLQHCTELKNLALQCRTLDFLPGCRLPTSLTYLSLSGQYDGLPSQASKLRRDVHHSSTPSACQNWHHNSQCLPDAAEWCRFLHCLSWRSWRWSTVIAS